MIVDKVRFVISQSCDYSGYKLYFGMLENGISEKWYYINDVNEISEMTEGRLNSMRIRGGNLREKHFYKNKIEKLRVEERKVMNVLSIRKM